jgi:hypothetical protein
MATARRPETPADRTQADGDQISTARRTAPTHWPMPQCNQKNPFPARQISSKQQECVAGQHK